MSDAGYGEAQSGLLQRTTQDDVAPGLARRFENGVKSNAPERPFTPSNSPSTDGFADRLTAALKKARTSAPPGDSMTSDLRGPAVSPATPAASTPRSGGPIGTGQHVVQQGQCVSSIAKDTGHFWETIWNDDANADLRRVRGDPNVLLPDDRLHVPPLRQKWEPGQTEMRHRYRRRGEPAVLRLTLQIDEVPLGNQPYTLEIDGRTLEGVTDPNGLLVQPIRPNARTGRLVVGEEQWTYELQLGHIDPVENLAGVQKRLINLGFDCGRTDGEWDHRCRQATREFQSAGGIEQTGDPDDLTRNELRQAHGS